MSETYNLYSFRLLNKQEKTEFFVFQQDLKIGYL